MLFNVLFKEENALNKPVLHSPDNLVFKRIDDFYLVLHPDIPNIMVVGDIGKKIFDLCNGTRSVNDILEEAGLKHEPNGIREFTSSLLSAGFLYTKPPPFPEKEVKHAEKLVRLYLRLTNLCNLRCRHCCVCAGPRFKDELRNREVLKLIKQFAELKGEELVITGGEPFLRRKLLYQIIKEARSYGIRKIIIETNGTLITKEDADICKKYEVGVGISLDGAKPETHSYIRGPGTHEKAINGIKMLVDAKVDVTIGVTLMQHNLGEVEEIVHQAKKLRANNVTFDIVRTIGRAKNDPHLAINTEDAISSLKRAQETSRKVRINTVIQDQNPELKMLTRKDRCGAGLSVLSIAANGDVYPCNMFYDQPEFRAGNIRKQTLAEIWKNSEVLRKLSNSSVLDVLECHDCELKFICFCCPAESFLAFGTLNKRPPLCPVYKELWWSLIEEQARKLWKES